MRELSQVDQLLFADLVQKTLDAEFDESFPENGSFVRQQRRGRDYWYYKGYERSIGDEPGRSYLKYVGPVSDPNIEQRVAQFGRLKVAYRARRELASKLRAAGLPSPTRLEGQVLEAMARAGIFRLRAVLVGSIAYQTYSGLLGVKLSESLMRTGDVDFAQFYGISQQIDDTIEDLQGRLQSVDKTFRPLFYRDVDSLIPGFIAASGFKVEFLTPNRGDKAYEAVLAPMPALGRGIGAQVLRFLDFLIKNPVRTVVLHDAGVAVTVPAPERYAVHKLIVSTLRAQGSEAKMGKDLAQVADLIAAFTMTRREADLGIAWLEAWERGASWRRRLLRACLRLSDESLQKLAAAVSIAAHLDGLEVEAFGLSGGRDEIVSRLAGRFQRPRPSDAGIAGSR